MKTLKAILVLLLGATSVFAQIDPNNMFISGYVLDANGMAVDAHEVCVYWTSNSPALPSDTICAITNNNGYYFLEVVNGSATGPNVTYTVQTTDTCIFLLLQETVSNGQGSIDTASVNFNSVFCASNCSTSFTSTNDSVNGTWTFMASSTGTAPFTYDWWVDGASYSTQTVSHMFNGDTVGVYLTITDANGCVSTDGDSLYLNGNPSNCSVQIITAIDSTATGIVYTLSASAGFASYLWSNNATTQSITVQNPSPTNLNGEIYCVTVSDGNGCTATACDTLLPINPGGCNTDFTYTSNFGNPNGTVPPGNPVYFTVTDSTAVLNNYQWSVDGMGTSMYSSSMNPVFNFPSTGTYQVCLTVYNTPSNCFDFECMTVEVVGNSSCPGSLVVSGPIGGGFPSSLLAASSGIPPFTYSWNTGENTPNITVIEGGIYCVYVTDSTGCIYQDCVTITDPNAVCDAAFTNSGPTPIGYSFTSDIHSPNWSYYWTIDNQFLGDGYDAYAPGLTNGAYTVCLTIVDSLNNCSDTQCQTITVGSNNCYAYISGEVFAGSNNQPLDEGVVYLILHDTVNNTLTAIDSLLIDSSNFFFFGPLTCGDYLIKAAATSGSQYYSGHIPTYHGNSPFWGFAQTVTLGQVNAQVTTDVTLIAANNPGGPGFIGGDVTQGANKTDPGDPLSGIQVMLFNLSGNAVAYTYTDANGQFGFSNLAYGTYQVYVEVLGVQTIPAIVTIGPDQPSVENVHILASESLISTGINEFDFDGAISDVYPNPVGNDASVRINLENEVMVDISILDLAGRMITTHTVSVSGGENTVSISASQLKDGYYFLNIQDVDGNFSVTRKFMRVD